MRQSPGCLWPSCCPSIVFVESWNQIADVSRDLRRGNSDECTLDVVPQLQDLSMSVNPALGCSAQSTCVEGIGYSCRPRTERGGEKRAADKGSSQEQVGSGAELLAPISSCLNPLLELSQVRAEPLSRAVDVSLYFVGCFIHSRFSLSESMVRSGTGVTRLNLRTPTTIDRAPTTAVATAVANVAAHIGMTAESA